MKKLLLFLLTLFSIQAFGQMPVMEMLVYPKYIDGTNNAGDHGVPYVYRAKITGLKPGLTYRYQNRLTTVATGSPTPYYLYILPPDNVFRVRQNIIRVTFTDLS